MNKDHTERGRSYIPRVSVPGTYITVKTRGLRIRDSP